MFEVLKTVFGWGAKAVDAVTGRDDKAREEQGKSQERQARINEAEISGAPQSGLRLWRSFLGWALAVAFLWEVMARPVIATYWPGALLPPSFMKEVTSLLLGMLGLGF